MKQRVFGVGRTKSWKGLAEFATGAPLGATAFAADFKGA